METIRTLVVEDDELIAKVIAEALAVDGHACTVAGTGEKGFFLAASNAFDLLICDRMLPDRDGLDVVRTMREGGCALPILMLTARDGTQDRVDGLEAGADDYLPKPFELPELVARVRALLRRSRGQLAQKLQLADLEVDVASREARRGGQVLALTAREFDVLVYLARRAGRVATRRALVRDVWSEPYRKESHDAVIDVHMARLRRKVDSGREPTLIRTVRGVGYAIGGGSPREPDDE